MFVNVLGEISLNSVGVNSFFYDVFWFLYILTLFLLVFRLVINPVYRYCNLFKSKKLSYLVTVLIFVASFFPAKLIHFDFAYKIIDSDMLCEVFKSRVKLVDIPLERKKETLRLICEEN